MKRKFLVTILAGTMLAAAVTGCGTAAAGEENNVNTESGVHTETETGANDTEAVVKPLYPLETAQDALADGGYSVSFTADDLVETDDGYELTVEVSDYDRYEMEAIDHLAKGSKIQFCGKEITVDQVDKNSDTGFVEINGGNGKDGFELTTDDGLYRTVTDNDYPVYYSVGTVTIPLSEDVTFEDQTNTQEESDQQAVGLKDLPEAIGASEIPFNCNNTVITVRQEQIVQIIRVQTP